jgi:predicted ATPase
MPDVLIPNALLFSRYRAFKDETRLELAPITLIIGRNGGGKSILTRLPLLLSSGLSSLAEAPLDLTAGGISHGSRYEDLVYQRSGRGFKLGAEIRVGTRTLTFWTTLIHVIEHHTLALEAFELFEDGRTLIDLTIGSLDLILNPRAPYKLRTANGVNEPNVYVKFVGLFPTHVEGQPDVSLQLSVIRGYFEAAFAPPSYLGPFRMEQASLIRIPRQGVRELGARGERALDVLGDDAIRGSGELVREVEKWFETAMAGHSVKLETSFELPRLVVEDRVRNVRVDIAETGAGFAQVLPVAIQAISRRIERSKAPLVIAEQPELHLHPGVHGAVADLLVQVAKECGESTRYLCETHSEQVVTRVRRRVADGSIPPSHVRIISVGHQSSVDEPQEPIRTILVDAYGNTNAWPIGVFDEAFEDLVRLREAARLREAE